jgi:intergrase/recombinase
MICSDVSAASGDSSGSGRISETIFSLENIQSTITPCINAKRTGDTYRSEEYICRTELPIQDLLYQAILDIQFRKLDEKIQKDLEQNTSGSGKELKDISKDLSNMFDESSELRKYPNAYQMLCNDIVFKQTGIILNAIGENQITTGDMQYFRPGGNE